MRYDLPHIHQSDSTRMGVASIPGYVSDPSRLLSSINPWCGDDLLDGVKRRGRPRTWTISKTKSGLLRRWGRTIVWSPLLITLGPRAAEQAFPAARCFGGSYKSELWTPLLYRESQVAEKLA